MRHSTADHPHSQLATPAIVSGQPPGASASPQRTRDSGRNTLFRQHFCSSSDETVPCAAYSTSIPGPGDGKPTARRLVAADVAISIACCKDGRSLHEHPGRRTSPNAHRRARSPRTASRPMMGDRLGFGRRAFAQDLGGPGMHRLAAALGKLLDSVWISACLSVVLALHRPRQASPRPRRSSRNCSSPSSRPATDWSSACRDPRLLALILRRTHGRAEPIEPRTAAYKIGGIAQAPPCSRICSRRHG